MADKLDVMYSLAIRIVHGELGKEFLFCAEEEKFYMYLDGYWKRIDNLELMGMILKYFDGHKIEENISIVNVGTYTVAKRNQILENLKPLIYKKTEEFNSLGYLNFDVGEYDPIKDFWHPHKKEHYSTLRFDYEYDSKATCELWIKTLMEIFEGAQDRVDILQEFFGYCLTRDNSMEKALLLLGESRSGKSTILETIGWMLGRQNSAFVAMDNVEHPQYTPLLMNKLVNIDTDVNGQAIKFERAFRIITSGEILNCNQKFVETFEFRPYCKIAMGANQFPRITDHSSAFYNRLILLPCDRVFLPEEQNRSLKKQLQEELPGIFNWACVGLQRLLKRGYFEEKEFINSAIQELREESNPTDIFFRENVEVDKINKVYIEKGELYQKYRQWSLDNNQYVLSAVKFGKAVFTKYNRYTEKNSMVEGGVRVWRNLKYKTNGVMAQAQEAIGWQD